MQSLHELHPAQASRRLPPTRRRWILIGAVVAVVCALAPAPALAVPPGLTRVVATSTLDTALWKEHRARCPEGTGLLSAGYEWIGGGNDLRLYGVQEFYGEFFGQGIPSGAMVAATQDPDGVDPGFYGASWGIRVVLLCARPLPGQQVHWASGSADAATEMKTAVARCPAGTNVLGVGGGVHWNPATRRLVIDENWTPNATLTAASVTAQEDESGTADVWRVWALAICAEPLPGLQRVAATSVGGSASYKDVTATCPPGKSVVGAGGDVRRGHGEVVMTALAPTPDLTGVRVVAREDDAGTDASWYAVAYAICA